MIKIGFITTPLSSGHAVRGVGFYTKRLLESIKPLAKNYGFEIIEVQNLHELQTTNYELIHYPYFDLFAHTLPIMPRSKTIVTIHDIIPLEFPEHYPPGLKGWFNLQLQKIALAQVDRVITDSYASINSIHKYLSVPHSKLKLIYLAADKKFKKLSRPTNKFNLPKKFVLYVGDIGWNKNIPNLITACKALKWPLVMVGKQAIELEKMDLTHPELRHLQKIDLSNVTRLGFVSDEDLIHIYNLATVYCQPSFAEGFGLPVLEALACGAPVACSNTHSLPEVAGHSATYFDPSNPDSIAKAIQNAFPPDLAHSQKFTWDQTAISTLQVYNELL